MIIRFLTSIACTALVSIVLVSVWPSSAFCKLGGEAELQYYDVDLKDKGGRHFGASIFTQRYSLLYETDGKFIGGKLGKYDIALGYEWTALDASFRSSASSGGDDVNISRGHIRYRGELLLDPKEIPFTLKAYSRDMNRNQFQANKSRLIFDDLGRGLELPDTINNGLHTESGVTLIMGVKNGMTNGYNEILRHFPMLLLDFRDIINKDTGSEFPTDNRLTRLAFVSLNKKDNWFHYRITNYNDYILPSNNYRETQIQLGTIDQNLQRHWVDFTNWLSLSADAQLTKRNNDRLSYLYSSSSSYTEFDMNLFGVARRNGWEARSFNNFDRLKEDNGAVTYRTTVPLYVDGELNRDTSLSTRFSYNDNHSTKGEYFTTVGGSYRVEALKRAPFTVSHQFGFENAKATSNSVTNVFGTLETNSTSRFSRLVGLAGLYRINYYSYPESRRSLLEQVATASANYAPNTRLRFSLSQTTRFVHGTSETVSSNIPGTVIGAPQYSGTFSVQSSSDTIQSTTTAAASWNPLARLNLSLTAAEDILVPADGNKNYETRVEARADYSTSSLSASGSSMYIARKEGNVAFNSYRQDTFLGDARVTYTYSRNLDAALHLSYYSSMYDSATAQNTRSLHAEQVLHYHIFKTNGVTRRLLEFTQTSEYLDESSRRTTTLSLGASYFPIKQLSLAAGSRHEFVGSDYRLSLYGSTGLAFRMFQATLDYYYGKRKSDGLTDKRLTANVRKSF